MPYTVQLSPLPVSETQGNTSCADLTIRLVNGGEISISAADLPLIKGRIWSRKRCGRHDYVISGAELMHRVLMGLRPGDSRVVDHIDGNGLNNIRDNLRVCERGENAKNRGPTVGRAEFKGVHRQGQAFIARIGAGDVDRYLGRYQTAVEAALAYNEAAPAAFGQFANFNVIPNESAVRALLEQRAQLKSQIAEINRQLREWPCE